MELHYDPAANTAFLQLSDAPVGRARCRTVSVDPWLVDGLVNLCLDDAGRVVGVEFCDASALLPSETLRPDTSTSAEGGITA
jgi:uncharacterized protein YuzE